MEQMTEKQAEAFILELKKLIEKHNIKDAAFTGTSGEKYLGIVGIEVKHNFGNFFSAVLNVGRLWQSAREKVKGLLNDYEKNV